MSWSFSYMGKVSKVVDAVENFASKQTGNSKTEFDAIKEGIKSLVKANFNNQAHNPSEAMVEVSGNGYGSFNSEGMQTDGSCTLTVKRLNSLLLE